MQELVIQSSKGADVTTSLIVAEVFGKEHSKVLRDIESLSCSDSFRVANFGEATFENSKTGQLHKMFEITKDGFSFLVMGYTGSKAGEFKEKFIREFNKREVMLRDDDYILMRSQQILKTRLEIAEQKLHVVTAEKAQLQLTSAAQQQELKAQAPEKKIAKLLGGLNVISIFAVRQFFISNDTGIFYAQKGTILKNIGKLYPNFIWLVSIKDCRRLGYFLPFLYLTNKFV